MKKVPMKTSPSSISSPVKGEGASLAVVEVITTLFDMIKENHRVSEEERTKRKEIKKRAEVAIEEIRSRRETMESYFTKAFSERRVIFERYFQLLDEGLAQDNLQLIEMSLSAILDLAKNSPLKEIQRVQRDFYDPNVRVIEL
ncbi:MAG: hypothetical protein GXO19_00305 [Epsilonproteobacteria bacterium]|nr:hypothetical protein [Campylobacterota bacterium]